MEAKLIRCAALLVCLCAPAALARTQESTSATLMGRGAKVDLKRFLNGVDESGAGLFGVKIPVFVSEQGQVEGDAAGHETGWGTLLARGASGKTDMDAPITLEAQGTITPGQGCTATGCSADDMLHVTQRGEQGQNSGVSHAQVGGRKFTESLSGGGGDGQISFDLPAYVGEHAEQTIAVGATGVEAKVSIEIVSLKRFEPGVVDGPGASLLWTAKGCKESQ